MPANYLLGRLLGHHRNYRNGFRRAHIALHRRSRNERGPIKLFIFHAAHPFGMAVVVALVAWWFRLVSQDERVDLQPVFRPTVTE